MKSGKKIGRSRVEGTKREISKSTRFGSTTRLEGWEGYRWDWGFRGMRFYLRERRKGQIGSYVDLRWRLTLFVVLNCGFILTKLKVGGKFYQYEKFFSQERLSYNPSLVSLLVLDPPNLVSMDWWCCRWVQRTLGQGVPVKGLRGDRRESEKGRKHRLMYPRSFSPRIMLSPHKGNPVVFK